MESKEVCKKIEQSIPLFLEGKLQKAQSAALLEHLKKCPGCREELEINYLLTEGIKRAENGENFNLRADLDELIAKAELRSVRFDRIKRYLISSAVALVLIALAVGVMIFFGL